MADEAVVKKLTVELEGTVKVNEASAARAGENAGKAIKSGMAKVMESASGGAAFGSETYWKNLTKDLNKAMNRVFLDVHKANNAKNWAEVQKLNQAYKDQLNAARYGSIFGTQTAPGFGDTLREYGEYMRNVASALAPSKDGLTKAFSGLGKAIASALKPMRSFFSAIRRIAIYRAIRWALKKITEGFQEGMQNAYQWSVVTGNQFAKSMDMMATSALYLKNSLGAMTMPLMNYLAPILDSLVDKFVELVNLVNQFIAAITGASSWVKALKYPAEYLEQAAGSARELKNQLLAFDELNVLNAPRGGGSASALDYSNMFQEMELNSSFADAIKDAIKNGDWKGIGKVFADKFNEMIGKIDAKGWASSLGAKINNAVSLVHTLLSETDFYQVGAKIGEFMSNLRLDWAKISGAWLRWKLKIFEIFMGIVQNVDWYNVSHAIGEAVKGLLNNFADWLNQLGTRQQSIDLGKWLSDIIAGVDWNGVMMAFYNALKALLKRGWDNAISYLVDPLGISPGGTSGGGGGSSFSPPPSNTNPNPGAAYGFSTSDEAYEAGMYSLGHQMEMAGYANGGFPKRGTMFYAGESGAEFVGNIGGNTGVYNADQMTVALATANEGVVETLAAVGNAIVTAINNKDTSINANDIRMAMRGMNLRYGV